MNSKKIGKLEITRELYTLEFIEKIPKILIIDINFIGHRDIFEIYFEHDSLQELPEGSLIPTYSIFYDADRFVSFKYD